MVDSIDELLGMGCYSERFCNPGDPVTTTKHFYSWSTVVPKTKTIVLMGKRWLPLVPYYYSSCDPARHPMTHPANAGTLRGRHAVSALAAYPLALAWWFPEDAEATETLHCYTMLLAAAFLLSINKTDFKLGSCYKNTKHTLACQ